LHAATFKEGKCTIHDAQACENFVQKYENDRAALQAKGTAIASWDEVIAHFVR
jgi:hypothetical protein